MKYKVLTKPGFSWTGNEWRFGLINWFYVELSNYLSALCRISSSLKDASCEPDKPPLCTYSG